MHTEFRILDKAGHQVDIARPVAGGWACTRVDRIATTATGLVSWFGKGARLCAMPSRAR